MARLLSTRLCGSEPNVPGTSRSNFRAVNPSALFSSARRRYSSGIDGFFARFAVVIPCGVRGALCVPRRSAGTQHFVQRLQGFAAVAIGIDADFIAKLSSQQAIDGYIERLAQYIPERRFDAANRVIDNARNRPGA